MKGPMYTWENKLPCLNPRCKSHGKPHPNCRCYGMAEGGEVMPFCDGEREHKEDCEYYLAQGGEVPDSDLSGVEVPASDMPEQSAGLSGQEVPPEDLPDQTKEEKYSTPMEQFKTAAEGAAEGFLGPVAPLIEEKVFGANPEDIKGRREANPMIHGGAQAITTVGSLVTGAGLPGMIAKGAGAAAKIANAGKIGSAAIRGVIEGASFVGVDEMTKSVIGAKGSDQESPVAAAILSAGAAGVMGGIGGTVFSFGEGLIGKYSPHMAKAAEDFLYKIGSDKEPLKYLGITEENAGKRLVKGAAAVFIGKELFDDSTGVVGDLAKGYIAYKVAQSKIAQHVNKITGRAVNKANDLAYTAVIKALMTNEASQVSHVFHYATKVGEGVMKANQAMDAMFKFGASKVAQEVTEKELDSMSEFIDQGQVQRQVQNSLQDNQFANGGMVSESGDGFSRVFPEQSALLSTAKGRVANYLNSLRPIPGPRLPFDKPSNDKDKIKEYKRAMKLAISPLRVLDKVNNGRLTPDHMKHFTAMYPEVYGYLSKEMTKKITEAQLKDERPPYRKMQSMGLFLGAALDSTFTPAAIQTIQGTFAMKRQAQQQQIKPKGSPKALSKTSNSYLTNEQSRERRMQSQK